MDEWQQYCYEQAKAWLEHIAKLKYAVMSSEDMVEMFSAYHLKALDYQKEYVSGSKENRLEEVIDNLEKAKRQWEANLVAFQEESTRAAEIIKQLEDETESCALLLHYVDTKTWEQVCVIMNYSYDGIMDLRKRAVLHVYDLLPLEWRDPRHTAT